MESSQQPSSGAESEESPAQRQARLRRERREAKIKAGGSSRLEKITQVSGRPLEPAPPPQTAFSTDADEVDNAHPTYSSSSTQSRNKNNNSNNAAPTEADIRALLRSGAPPPGIDSEPGQQGQGEEENPMMRMLQQIMGEMGGQGQEGGEGGLPPGLAAMLGGGGGGAGMPQAAAAAAAAAPPATSAYIWRILHAVSALILGIYLTTHTTFSSTPRLTASRSTAPPPSSPALGNPDPEHAPQNMFWIFAATELVLQGSKYFLEQGRSQEQQAGWVGMLGRVLPEPWKGWLRLAVRYRGIWSTLAEDSMVVVFVLGVVGWWQGLGV